MEQVRGQFELIEQTRELEPFVTNIIQRLPLLNESETNRTIREATEWLRDSIIEIRNRPNITIDTRITFIRDAIFSYDVRTNPEHPFHNL